MMVNNRLKDKLLIDPRKMTKDQMKEFEARKKEFEKKIRAATTLAIALGDFVKRGLTYFMTKMYEPGMEVDMRVKIVNAVREGLMKALDKAITVNVNDKGIVMPRFDEDRFYTELEKEFKNENSESNKKPSQ